MQKENKPYVYLIGAGPGDVELLTLKAVRILQQEAKTIIYDRLVNKEILDIAPKSVKKIYAGKTCKSSLSLSQTEINQLIIQEANKGQKIARLKGGCSTIFARLGEEITALKQANIPFQVVPGISAAQAIASRLHIPLTERDLASSLYFITGHKKNDRDLINNWQLLADENATIVVYMGMANLEYITANLLQNGMNPTIPAVCVYNGTLEDEKILTSDLANIATEVQKHKFQPPSLVIISKVLNL